MKGFLRHGSRRFGYDGWALKVPGAAKPMAHTVSTTREEVREIRREMVRQDLFHRFDVVKVRIKLEVTEITDG